MLTSLPSNRLLLPGHVRSPALALGAAQPAGAAQRPQRPCCLLAARRRPIFCAGPHCPRHGRRWEYSSAWTPIRHFVAAVSRLGSPAHCWLRQVWLGSASQRLPAIGRAATAHAMAACRSSRVLKARNVCTFSSSMPALQTGQTRQWLCTCIHLRTRTHDIPCTKPGRQRPVATHVMFRCIACCSAAGASRYDHVKGTVWSKTSGQYTPSLQGSEQHSSAVKAISMHSHTCICRASSTDGRRA